MIQEQENTSPSTLIVLVSMAVNNFFLFDFNRLLFVFMLLHEFLFLLFKSEKTQRQDIFARLSIQLIHHLTMVFHIALSLGESLQLLFEPSDSSGTKIIIQFVHKNYK
jgi:hypothetical protein